MQATAAGAAERHDTWAQPWSDRPATPHAGARRRRAVREPKEAFLPGVVGGASATTRECLNYHAEVAARSPRRSQPDEPEAPGARSAGRRPRRAHPRKGLPWGGAPAPRTPAASRPPGRRSCRRSPSPF